MDTFRALLWSCTYSVDTSGHSVGFVMELHPLPFSLGLIEKRGVEESGTGLRNGEAGGTELCSDTPLLLPPTPTLKCQVGQPRLPSVISHGYFGCGLTPLTPASL